MIDVKLSLRKILNTAALFCCLFLLSTCDVGLGPSVDTTAPDINIESPTASQVMNGTLSLGGVATDDGKITSVVINLKGLGTTTGLFDYNATLADNRWSLVVDTINGSQDVNGNVASVKDGTYQLTVTATDESKKTSTQTTTFTVDNTPPVIIVTSPDEKNSSMNYDLQFEGKIYDLTEVDSITVSVYDEAGNEKASMPANLFGTSEWKVTFDGQSDLRIGTAEAKLANSSYYYSVKASDKKGNTSTYFFHKADIYDRYSNNRLSVDDWAAFDKGDKNDVAGVSLDRAWLGTIRIPASITTAYSPRAKFDYSTEPVAQIVWNNISTDTSDDDTSTITNLNSGDSIIGSITPPTGVDSPFRNETFECYIWKTTETLNTTVHKVADDKISITNIGTARSFAINTEGLQSSQYNIYITIKNSSNTSFEDSQKFAIALGAPIIEFCDDEQTTDDERNLVNKMSVTTRDTGFVFRGKALISTREDRSNLSYELSVNGGEKTTGTITTAPIPSADADPATGYWELPLPDEDGTYAYVFTATSDEYRTTVSRTITLDTTAPVVSITAPTGEMTGESSLSSSQYIFRGNAEDANGMNGSGTKEIKYAFVKVGDGYNATVTAPSADSDAWQTLSTSGGWTITRSLASGVGSVEAGSATSESTLNEGHWYLFVKAVDNAGNVSRDSDIQSVHFHVDLNSPSLSSVTIDGTAKNENSTSYTKESSFALAGTVSDTYGVESVSVNGSTSGVTFADGSWSYTYPVGDADKDKEITATVTVTDKAGKTASKRYYLYRDTKAPEVEATNPADEDSLEDTSIKLKGTASDAGSGVASVSYTITSENGTEVATGTVTPKGESWNTTVELTTGTGLASGEGNFTLVVSAVDKSGNTSDASTLSDRTSRFSVDANDPELTVNIGTSGLTTSSGFTLYGFVHDTNALYTGASGYAVTINAQRTGAEPVTIPFALSELTQVTSDNYSSEEIGATEDKIGWYKWTKTFCVGSESTGTGAVHLADGTYTFSITARDIAKKTTVEKRTVIIDTTAPAFATSSNCIDYSDTAEQKPVDAETWFTVSVISIKVNVDDNGSGLASVKYETKPGEGTTGKTGTLMQSSGCWSASVPLSEGTNNGIRIVATDNAGNVSYYPAENPAGTAQYETIRIDTKLPTLTMTGNTSDMITSEGFSLEGTASDDGSGIASVTVSVKNADDESDVNGTFTMDNSSTGGIASDGSWGISFTTSTQSANGLADGYYSITITAKDRAGGESSKTKKVKVDTTAPTIEITAPTGEITGESSLSSSQYIFRGNADDANGAKGSGTKEIKYAFVKAEDTFSSTVTPPSADSDAWQTLSTSGGWTITRTLAKDVGSVEAGSATSESTLNEGHWYLFVKAVDNAGNETDIESVHFHVDLNSPSLSDVKIDNVAKNENSTSYTKESSFALAGTVSDTYGVESVSVNGSTSGVTLADGSWSYMYQVPDPDKDKEITATVTVTDKAGKATSKRYYLYMDTEAPEVEATNPADEDSLETTSIKLKGTVSDAGSGVESVNYTITREGGSVVASGTATLKGESWSKDNVDLGSGEGSFTLVVSAVDKSGNTSDSSTLSDRTSRFSVDANDPELTVNIGTSGLTTHSGFTLSGFVYDTNALYTGASGYAVTINAQRTGAEPISIPFALSSLTQVTSDNREELGATNNQVGWYKWSKTFTVGSETNGTGAVHLDDGTYTFSITARDIAKKTTVEKRTVIIDTTAPSLDHIVYPATGYTTSPDNTVWRKSSTMTISADVTETGSGLTSVEYEIKDGDSGSFRTSATDDFPNRWSTPISLSEGKNEIRIIATDKAGNVFYYPAENPAGTAQYEEVYVDTQVPSITIDNGSALITRDTVNGFTLSGFVYDSNGLYYGASGAAVTISAANDFTPVPLTLPTEATPNTGMTLVTSDNREELDATEDQIGWYKWTKTFVVGVTNAKVPGSVTEDNPDGTPNPNYLADGTYNFTITAKDVAERVSSPVTRKVQVDTTPPAFPANNIDFSDTGSDKIKTGNDNNTWYTDAVVKISVTVTDTNGSGISTVEYETVTFDNSGNVVANSASTGVLRKPQTDNTQTTSNVWKASVPLNDGDKNGLRIIATDEAGNISYFPANNEAGTAQYERIRIDTQVPTINIEDSSFLLTNEHFSISGDASDALPGSGIESVTATVAKKASGEFVTIMDPVNTDEAKIWTMTNGVTGGGWRLEHNIQHIEGFRKCGKQT